MSREKLFAIAQKDADEVKLPEGWPGFLAWVATKFGVSAVFAGIVMFGTWKIYEDQKQLNRSVLEAFIMQTTESAATRTVLERIERKLETKP